MNVSIKMTAIVAAGIIMVFLLYGRIDLQVIYAFAPYRDTMLYDLSKLISETGLIHWWLIASAAIWLNARYHLHNVLLAAKARFFFVSVALSGILVIPLKFIFGKARPDKLFDEGIYGFQWFVSPSEYGLHGFPSGHTTTAFSVATALALLYPKYTRLWYGCAVLVGLSRIGVLYHYPSDVVAGAVLGTVITLTLARWMKVI